MTAVCKLKSMLPTYEGLTLRGGTEVAVTDEFVAGSKYGQFRIILVGDARYRVREEDLVYACGEL